MAGFIDRFRDNKLFSGIADAIREISTLGIRYNDMLIKNSRAVGATEAQFMKQGIITDENLAYTLALSDTSSKKYIAYFDKDYPTRRDFLRSFALNGEIQFVVDTIADDAVVMDTKNQFCYPVLIDGDEFKDDVKKGYEENFKKIYAYWQFNDDMQAHQLFRQFLIDGFLAFEIIYNDNGKKIIGFKELDPTSLRPGVEKEAGGELRKVWYQYEENLQMGRKLYDSQIIYISFAKGNIMSRVSYVETLVRSFNILRIMEQTRVIWSVMNSSYRMKMIVPIGSKSPQKAKESLSELMNLYKEDIKFDLILQYASIYGHLDIVKYLVEHGSNIHANNDYALRWASYNGYLDVVKYLVEHGANIHAKNDEALRDADERNHFNVFNYLKSLS